MARVRHVRDALLIEQRAKPAHPLLMASALEAAHLQMLDRGNRARGKRRRQRGRAGQAV